MLFTENKPMNNGAGIEAREQMQAMGKPRAGAFAQGRLNSRHTSEKLRLLLVENSIHDELSIINELHCGGFEVLHQRVETSAQFLAELKAGPWDLVICDYDLRESDGLTLLKSCQQLGLDLPFIMVSSAIGEELAVEVLKAGANDCVMKRNLSRLVPALRRELRAAQERYIRRQTATTQAFLASVVESCHDAIIGETLEGRVVSWNRGAERLYGYTAAEMIGRPASILVPAYRPEPLQEVLEKLRRGEPVEDFVTVCARKDGSTVEVSMSFSLITDANGRTIGASTVARDITQWKQQENEHLSLIQELTSALAVEIRHIGPEHARAC